MDVNVAAIPAARAGHGAVRDHDQRVAGAHAGHRRARGPRRGAGDLRAVGGAGQRHRQGHARARHGDDDGGRLRMLDGWDGEVLADMPAASLHEDAPLYDRPRRPPAGSDEATRTARRSRRCRHRRPRRRPARDAAPTPWVWSQYDHQLFLNTVEGPGGDAAVLRLKHPITGIDTGRGLALTTDGNHRWCAVDPRQGTALTVAESVLNLACVGARPLAVVNCLNFGNPEHPEVMWQLSEAIDGMAEACRAFGDPRRRRQRQPLQRVHGRRHRPDAGHRHARRRRSPRPAAAGRRPGRGRPPRAGRCHPARAVAVRRGPAPRATAAAGSRRSTSPSTPRSPTWCARWWPAGMVDGIHDVGRRRPRPGAGRDGGALGRRLQRGPHPRRAELFSESPSRVVLCVAPELLQPVLRRAASGRRAHRPHRRGRRRPALGQGPARRRRWPRPPRAWRDRLPTPSAPAPPRADPRSRQRKCTATARPHASDA